MEYVTHSFGGLWVWSINTLSSHTAPVTVGALWRIVIVGARDAMGKRWLF